MVIMTNLEPYITVFFVSWSICMTAAVVCPDSSQWNLRSKSFCNSSHPSYNCLYDESTSTFVEFCTMIPDFQRPGYKFIIRGNIDGIECQKKRFQPIKFWTNGSYNCLLQKTACIEQGQVIHDEGNSTSDGTCRCDYTRGFAFVSRPKQDCFCIPSLEDCSYISSYDTWRTRTTSQKVTQCPKVISDNMNQSPMMIVLKKNTVVQFVILAVFGVIVIVIVFWNRCKKVIQYCRNLTLTAKKMEDNPDKYNLLKFIETKYNHLVIYEVIICFVVLERNLTKNKYRQTEEGQNAKLKQFENTSTARNMFNLKQQIKNLDESTSFTSLETGRKARLSKFSPVSQLALKEQVSVGKECEELKFILQDKQDELNKLKLRFQVQTGLKETLQQENADLNERLALKEDVSVGKECEELKIILKHKQGELNKLTLRFQVQTSLKETLQQENADLNQRLQVQTGLKETLQQENADLNQRLKNDEVELLYNSLKTERHEHETAMKRLEMKYTALLNECVELWLILQNIHTSSEISFEKLVSVIDQNIFRQKLEETTAQENMLAKETTIILKNFAAAKDKKGCIKVLKKRFEKSRLTCDTGISSDEKTDMEDIDNDFNSSCKKYYQETLMESRATTACHNRMSRTTNVFNVNIASSKVSINKNTEEQFPCLDGSNGQYPAIDEGQ